MLYQLTYEATQLGGDQFVGVMCCDKSTNEGKKFVLLKCRDKVRGSLLCFVPISMLVYNLKVLSELPPVNRICPTKLKVTERNCFWCICKPFLNSCDENDKQSSVKTLTQ